MELICRNCQHSTIQQSSNAREREGIAAMAKMGYRSCSASRTPEERGRYFTGGNVCVYPERFVAK